MSDVPEIEEYVGTYEWSAKCLASNCKWHASGERSYEDWMTDMIEDIAGHKQWHEDGMPQ